MILRSYQNVRPRKRVVFEKYEEQIIENYIKPVRLV